MNKQFVLVLGICVAMVSGATWLFGTSSGKTSSLYKSVAATNPANEPAPAALPNSPAVIAQANPLAPVSKIAALNNLLLRSDDLRVFTELAKQRPQDGGIYFAKTINNYCWDVQEFLSSPTSLAANLNESHKVATQRDASVNKLRRLCGGFLISEANASGFAQLVTGPSAKADPMLKAEQSAISASLSGDISQRKAAVQELLDSAAPLVIVNAPLGQINSNGGMFFDGKFYGGKNDPQGGLILQAARLFAACKFGDNCGPEDRMLLLPCAVDGVCVNDRFEFVAASFAKNSLTNQQYQEAVQLSEKMVAAIESKNVEAFFSTSSLN
jgi:hypothetical protein